MARVGFRVRVRVGVRVRVRVGVRFRVRIAHCSGRRHVLLNRAEK